MRPRVIFLTGLLITTAVVAAVFAPAVELGLGGTGAFTVGSRLAFSPICHQDPARSFVILGAPLSVCARCTGIYLGFWLAWLAWHFVPVRLRDRAVTNRGLALGFAPLALDGLINALVLFTSPAEIRFVTGLIFGAVAARALWPALLSMAEIVSREILVGRANPGAGEIPAGRSGE